jgi:hypothetical protein
MPVKLGERREGPDTATADERFVSTARHCGPCVGRVVRSLFARWIRQQGLCPTWPRPDPDLDRNTRLFGVSRMWRLPGLDRRDVRRIARQRTRRLEPVRDRMPSRVRVSCWRSRSAHRRCVRLRPEDARPCRNYSMGACVHVPTTCRYMWGPVHGPQRVSNGHLHGVHTRKTRENGRARRKMPEKTLALCWTNVRPIPAQ